MFSILIVVPILINIILEILPGVSLEGIIFYQDAIILAALSTAVVYVHFVYASFAPQDGVRKIWQFFLIGVSGFAVGELIYFVYEVPLQNTDPFPCLGDVFIVGGYLAFIWAAVEIFRKYAGLPIFEENYGRTLSRALSTLFTLIVLAFVIYPSIGNGETPFRLRLIAQVYPLLDLIGFVLYIRLFLLFLSMGNTRFSRPWLILTFAFIVSLMADSAYTFSDNYGIEFLYSWVNLSWYTAYALLALAFHRQYLLLRSIPTPKDTTN